MLRLLCHNANVQTVYVGRISLIRVTQIIETRAIHENVFSYRIVYTVTTAGDQARTQGVCVCVCVWGGGGCLNTPLEFRPPPPLDCLSERSVMYEDTPLGPKPYTPCSG